MTPQKETAEKSPGKIPTIQDFIDNTPTDLLDKEMCKDAYYESTVKKLCIKFAKMHVQAALQAAANKTTYGMLVVPLFTEEQQKSILNAYPDELIK